VVDTASATSLSLGTGFSNNVNIGKTATGTTTVNNALTATGLITANNGLTIATTKNITLGTANASVNTQLGWVVKSTTRLVTSFVSTPAVNICSITIPTTGVWLFSGSMVFFGAGTGATIFYDFDTATTVQMSPPTAVSYNSMTLPAYPFYATGGTTYHMKGQNNSGVNTDIFTIFFSAVRIG
jgi:hypothetical protein